MRKAREFIFLLLLFVSPSITPEKYVPLLFILLSLFPPLLSPPPNRCDISKEVLLFTGINHGQVGFDSAQFYLYCVCDNQKRNQSWIPGEAFSGNSGGQHCLLTRRNPEQNQDTGGCLWEEDKREDLK